MTLNIELLTTIVMAYLFGSISSAILVCKLMHLPDPRLEGSKNPGATNVLRLGGKKAAFFTLLGDTLKGVIPVLVAKWLGLDALGLAFVIFAAFIGHLYPIFFGFVGGKGVATALGCLFALDWRIGSCWVATWILVAAVFRYSSLSALIASLLAPLYTWHFTQSRILTLAIALMSLLLIFRHRTNIKKLLTKTERKIGSK